MPNTLVDGAVAELDPPSRLGFTFRLAGGTGQLSLSHRTFFGWLNLDRLELEVPHLRLPVDLAAGPEAFQRHRTRVRHAALRMAQADLDCFVAQRADQLAGIGVEDLRLQSSDGGLSLSARVRESGHAAELTARLYLDAREGALRLACNRALSYGFLPTAAPVLAHRILHHLVSASSEGLDVNAAGTAPGMPTGTSPGIGVATAIGRPGTERDRERTQADDRTAGPWSSAVRGLGAVEIDPLGLTLWHILPLSGWRLPDTSDLVIASVRLEPGALSLLYGPRAGGATGEVEDPGPGADTSLSPAPEVSYLFDALERMSDVDERLLAGEIDSAMRLYRARLTSHPDDEPLLYERLLAVAASRRELFDECSELSARALARWPDFAPAHAALAAMAAARGDTRAAGGHLRTLSQIAATGADREAATRAALAGARLLRRTAPAEATPLYERVLELSPHHLEATDALAERYADEHRFADLVRLLRERATLHQGSGDLIRRARDHVRVAEILVTELGDPEAARAELDRATGLDPTSPGALEVLAQVEAAQGRTAAAADSLERAAVLYSDRRDRRGRARALLRAAALREQGGEAGRAEAGYRAVLEILPGEPGALRGAARAAARRGDHAGAADLWRSLLALAPTTPGEAARDSLDLAESLLAQPGAAARGAARQALERAIAAGPPQVVADAHSILADLATADGRPGDAAQHLGRAVDALADAVVGQTGDSELRRRAARMSLARAEILAGPLSRPEQAVAEQERAFALADEADPARLTAARALAAEARARGDRSAERLWLAAMLHHPGCTRGERATRLVRRAELASQSGEDLPAALADLDQALDGGELPAEQTSGALALRAEVLGALGDHTGQARALERALEAAPAPGARIELHVAAARALLDTGDGASALAHALSAMSALDRDDAPEADRVRLRLGALAALGEAAWRARDFSQVERAYRELVHEPSPERAERAHRLGQARETLGQLDEAAEAYELVIIETGTPVELRIATWRSLAALYEHTADLARAALAYESFAGDERAALGDLARAEAWHRAGDLYRKAGGREPDARRCLEAALTLVPDHLPALDVLERIERDAGDFERVSVILGRKIAATARQPASQKSLLCRLAQLQEEKLDRLDVARETYARALAIDPDYRPALRYAARDARARGDLDAAVKSYSRLASVLPGDRDLSGAGDELGEERIAAALDLAALAVSAPSRPRSQAAVGALRDNLEAAPGQPQLARALASLEGAATGAEDAVTQPRAADPWSELCEQARVAVAAGQPEAAFALLDPAPRERSSDELLELRAEVADGLGDSAGAHGDLEALRGRGAARSDAALELRATRRLAALVARHGEDDRRAVELYQRVLALDPDDLGAAEACAEIFSRRRESSLYRSALVRVLEVVRKTGAGHAREVRALRQLAWAARSQDDLAAAAEHLDEACAIDPNAIDALRERADLALEQGDPAAAAEWLETLAERLEQLERLGRAGRAYGHALGPAARGEVLLELADIYYDQIQDLARARRAMRRAADALGKGARRDATLRLLASEAAAAGEPGQAAEALEAIPSERLSPGDRLSLATCYQRLGQEQRAIELLEAARSRGVLSDEGALLLFALGRHRKQREGLERVLRRGPRDTEVMDVPGPGQAGARTGAAPDHRAGAAPDHRAPGDESGVPAEDSAGPSPDEIDDRLEAAQRLEQTGNLDAAAIRYEELWAAAPADLRPLEALERIYLERGDADLVSEVLGRMVLATEDRKARAALWFRRAKLYRDLLHREPEAYRCLKEAFANDPDQADVAHALRSIAMARGEWDLAAELCYREIDAAGDPGECAAIYNELGLIYDEKLLDAEQASRCYEHALALDPEIPAAPRPLARLYSMAGRHADAGAMYEKAAGLARGGERAGLLRLAAASLERVGQEDHARTLRARADDLVPAGENLAADQPSDAEPDLAPGAAPAQGPGSLHPSDSVPAPVLASGSAPASFLAPEPAAPAAPTADRPSARIRMLEDQLGQAQDSDRRGDLRRQIIELATRAGDQATVARHAPALVAEHQVDLSAYLALRNQAAASENWPALAALLAARAAALTDPGERADLFTELGRIYDKHLGDQGAAAAAYEQALAAAPDHAAALESLAELAYLTGDWLRARDLYQQVSPASASIPPELIQVRRGEIAEVLGRDSEAAAAFAEAVRLGPQSRTALTALTRTALRAGDLDQAAQASRALLELIPPDDVRAVRAARLQLAELCQRGGDAAGAVSYYEQVLADEPKSITALSNLLSLYGEAGDHPAAARVLRSLIALTPAPAQRAELLYRLGELSRRSLGNPETAADSYLKAIDLDPDHLPTLRRLLEYYWKGGDGKNLLDVAGDLQARGALFDPGMEALLLAAVALFAWMRGSADLARDVARHLAAATPSALAGAMVEATGRFGGGQAGALVEAALELTRIAGVADGALRVEIDRRAADDQRARELAMAWPAARS